MTADSHLDFPMEDHLVLRIKKLRDTESCYFNCGEAYVQVIAFNEPKREYQMNVPDEWTPIVEEYWSKAEVDKATECNYWDLRDKFIRDPVEVIRLIRDCYAHMYGRKRISVHDGGFIWCSDYPVKK